MERDSKGKFKKREMSAALKIVDVHKIYGTGENAVQALKGININFRKNEFVSILGPSGCGKTTLLNIIGGLDRYSSGDLIIDGRSTKKYNDKDWDAYRNNSIGFVFQTYNLIPHQTVCANVELALELSGVSKKARREKALAILEKVGLKGQENKKPNQLSGGQMQRVAIARALINDPEIILADEPTGALDTETSIQVLDLLKEVAKDRLVIMVTHNPELAERYSSRIIKLVDGKVVGDSNPFIDNAPAKPKKIRKPKMGLKTAFMLSLRNLFSKKTRTILVSFAGSIGIFGIALVLALSNGFNAYMSRMQTDTLSTYPLTISESSVDLSTFNELFENEMTEKHPELDNVLVHEAFKNLIGMLKSNDLADKSENGFVHYLNQVDPELYYALNYDYGFNQNTFLYTEANINGQEMFVGVNSIVNMIGGSFQGKLGAAMGGMNYEMVAEIIPTTQEMPDRGLVLEQYDVLYGELPEFNEQDANKMVLVVDQYNGLSDITMLLLGYISGEYDTTNNSFKFEQKPEIELSEIVGENSKKLYLAKNSLMYQKIMGNYYPNVVTTETDGIEEIEVVGIIRAKPDVTGVLKEGLAYSPALTKKILAQNIDSQIVKDAVAGGGKINVTIPDASNPMGTPTVMELNLRSLAGVDTPAVISVYAKNFDAKEQIKAHIDAWNADLSEDDAKYIHYADMMSDMFGFMGTMVDAVSYVLIAFTSISLIVSSVMIGIITYISVVERTKEIGVLRALGASKGEVSNVFNAETFIIGMMSGLIGIGVTYLLSIPINLLLSSLVTGIGNIASLSPISAVILVCVSVILTFIAGLIPSRIAAKKDPVNALRSE